LRSDFRTMLAEASQITCPLFLEVTLRLCAVMPPDILEMCFDDLKTATEISPANRETLFTCVRHWERILLEACLRSPGPVREVGLDTLHCAYLRLELSLLIFFVISCFSFRFSRVADLLSQAQSSPSGWMCLVRLIAVNSSISCRETVRAVICRVLDDIVMRAEPSEFSVYNLAHISFALVSCLEREVDGGSSSDVWLFESVSPRVGAGIGAFAERIGVHSDPPTPFSDDHSIADDGTPGRPQFGASRSNLDESTVTEHSLITSFDVSAITEDSGASFGSPELKRVDDYGESLHRIALRHATLNAGTLPPEAVLTTANAVNRSPLLMASPMITEPSTPPRKLSLPEPLQAVKQQHVSAADVAVLVLNCWDRLLCEVDAVTLLSTKMSDLSIETDCGLYCHTLLRLCFWLLNRLPHDSPRAVKILFRVQQCVIVLLNSYEFEARTSNGDSESNNSVKALFGRGRSGSISASSDIMHTPVTPTPTSPKAAPAKQWILYAMWECHELLRKSAAKLSTVSSTGASPTAVASTVTALARGVVDILATIAGHSPGLFAMATFDESCMRLFMKTIVATSDFGLRTARAPSEDSEHGIDHGIVTKDGTSPPEPEKPFVVPYWTSHSWLSQPGWCTEVPAAVSSVMSTLDGWQAVLGALLSTVKSEWSVDERAVNGTASLDWFGEMWVKADTDGRELMTALRLQEMTRASIAASAREDEHQLLLKRWVLDVLCVKIESHQVNNVCCFRILSDIEPF
jgi:hypothetical protein